EYDVKSHSSSLEDDQAQAVMERVSGERVPKAAAPKPPSSGVVLRRKKADTLGPDGQPVGDHHEMAPPPPPAAPPPVEVVAAPPRRSFHRDGTASAGQQRPRGRAEGRRPSRAATSPEDRWPARGASFGAHRAGSGRNAVGPGGRSAGPPDGDARGGALAPPHSHRPASAEARPWRTQLPPAAGGGGPRAGRRLRRSGTRPRV